MRAVGLWRALPIGTAAPQGQRRSSPSSRLSGQLSGQLRGAPHYSLLLTPAQRRASPTQEARACSDLTGQRDCWGLWRAVASRQDSASYMQCAPQWERGGDARLWREGGGWSSRAVVRGLWARRRDCAERRCSRGGVHASEGASPAQVPARCRGVHRGAARVAARCGCPCRAPARRARARSGAPTRGEIERGARRGRSAAPER